MKKRIFLLMMVSALLMAFAGSAWAANANADYYTITGVTASPSTASVAESGAEVTINLTAAVGYQSASSTSTPAGYVKSTSTLNWSITDGSDYFSATFDPASGTVEKTSATSSLTTTATGTVTFPEGETSVTITFQAKLGTSAIAQTAEVTISLVTSLGSADKMAFTTKKVDALKVGEEKEFKIEGKGAGPFEYDVYVAAKDAIKLGWAEKGSTENISLLNTENITANHIPFTVGDVTTSIADKKGQKFSIPITYNGAQVAYKGFPLTVAVWNEKNNKNGTYKPTTKTFKIDINPNGTPIWIVQSGDAEAEEEKAFPFTYDETEDAGDEDWTATLQGFAAARWAATPKKGWAIEVPLTAEADKFTQHFVVSGDAPYEVTVKPADGKSGIHLEVTQPTYTDDGSIKTPAYVTVTGPFDSDTQEKGKEAKVALTATVTNTSTKKKTALKINVVGKLPPEFQNTVEKSIPVLDEDGNETGDTTPEKHFVPKRIESPKKVNIKLKAKGSKTISYSVDEATETLLEENYLSFDKKKAAIFSLKRTDKDDPYKGKEHSNPTVDAEGNFESLDIVVYAENSAGQDEVHVEVGVAGAKPKFKTKKLTISRGDHAWLLDSEVGDTATDYAVAGIIELANITSQDTGDGDVVFTNPDGALEAAGMALLSKDFNFGEATDEDNQAKFTALQATEGETPHYGPNVGMIVITDRTKFVANKGVKAEIYANNYGTEGKGKVTITIADPKPEIEETDTSAATLDEETGVYTYTAEASDSDSVTLEIGLKLTDDTKPTDDKGKVKWTLESKPNKPVSAKLKADASDNSTATLTLTYKNKNATAASGTVKVSATNSLNKLTSEKYPINYEFTAPAAEADTSTETGGALPGNNGSSAKTSAESEADAEDTEDAEDADAESESEEATITTGVERTAADLSAAQQAFLAAKGLKVIAVLPEISANVEGQQKFEDVVLDEDAPEGAKMVYVPFPQDVEETEDDKIADFYGADGEDIEEVPAEKAITVAPWLRADVVYQPVIAAEAE